LERGWGRGCGGQDGANYRGWARGRRDVGYERVVGEMGAPLSMRAPAACAEVDLIFYFLDIHE
jgi:hypothetical protein